MLLGITLSIILWIWEKYAQGYRDTEHPLSPPKKINIPPPLPKENTSPFHTNA